MEERGRRVKYRVSFITVRLSVIYRGGRRVKTDTEMGLEKESERLEVALSSLYPS